MATAPDTLFVTGPVFKQLKPSEVLVTPTGGSQQTLANALAGSGGGSLSLKTSGVTSNILLGVLPANSWLLRLLVRDINQAGGMVGLGKTLGATDILSLQDITGPYYSLTVDITGFAEGSFANGATPSIYLTLSGAGMSLTPQLDYELGP